MANNLTGDFVLGGVDVEEQTPVATQNAQTKPEIIAQVQKSAEQAITKKAADNTIVSGTSGASTVQAVQNTKADIVSGKQQPGFFDGIAGFIGDFAKSDIGTTLLSGIAGQTAAGQFGVGNTAGFLSGAKGGMDQIIKNRESQAVKTEKNLAKLLTTNDTATKGEDKLRVEFNPIQKQFNTIQAANDKLQAGLARKTAAGDLAGIFAYMKVLDPGSTVREGEFANAQNSAGIPDRVRAAYNNAKDGIRLGPDQRLDFMATSKILFSKEQAIFDDQKSKFTDIADNRQLDKQNIFGKEKKVKKTVSKNDEARAWATANPNNPKAKLILDKIGG